MTRWLPQYLLVISPFVELVEGSKRLAEKARRLFHHGFDGYLRHAYPLDEILPLSCTGIGPDRCKASQSFSLEQEHRHEIRGGYCLTLIDSMDTLAIMGDVVKFHEAVDLFLAAVHSFDIDLEMSTFEVNIRALGGLLSCHQFCSGSFGRRFIKPGYKGRLQELAVDLADRLLPAFNTKTGIPVARINLRTGRPTKFMSNCPAAAGTFILEFGVLSQLTGNRTYYDVALNAILAVWQERSALGLVGYEINPETGAWNDPASTIGAGVDSYFEYMLKGYIMFGEPALLEMFEASLKAISKHTLTFFGELKTVNYATGSLRSYRVDALGAFFPGLLTLAGELTMARHTFDRYYLASLKYGDGLLVEAFDGEHRQVIDPSFNLRPELVESAYYLYRATKDPFYLRVGESIMDAIEERCRTECGYAALSDAKDGLSKLDRSETFVLSETLKYLYLLFEEDHWIGSGNDQHIFTTEAHLLVSESKFDFYSNKARTCPFKFKIPSHEMHVFQAWKLGLRLPDQAVFERILHVENLFSKPRQSSANLSQNVEKLNLPEGALLYLARANKLMKPSELILAIWPDLSNPGYWISKVDGKKMGKGLITILAPKDLAVKAPLKFMLAEEERSWYLLPAIEETNGSMMLSPIETRPNSQAPLNITVPHTVHDLKSFTELSSTPTILRLLSLGNHPLLWNGLPVRDTSVFYLRTDVLQILHNRLV